MYEPKVKKVHPVNMQIGCSALATDTLGLLKFSFKTCQETLQTRSQRKYNISNGPEPTYDTKIHTWPTILVLHQILSKTCPRYPISCYETCSKNVKFVRFYLKRLFDISIFGKKIYLTMDVGYVNKQFRSPKSLSKFFQTEPMITTLKKDPEN